MTFGIDIGICFAARDGEGGNQIAFGSASRWCLRLRCAQRLAASLRVRRVRVRVRRYVRSAGLLAVFLVAPSFAGGAGQAERPSAAIGSVYTDLSARSCKELIDQADPNNTPYQTCPGVSGYSLNVRHVDSGRQSVDVVTPGKGSFPLDYHEFITRHMFRLDTKAEWRVVTRNGTKTPIALIVRVRAQEDPDDPEKVTRSFLALAKITPTEACVTDRILEGSLPRAKVRSAADSAKGRKCLEPQPHLVVDGVIIR